MIHVGFTGTRYGMSHDQHEAVKKLLWDLVEQHNEIEFHHGDCVGADLESH